MLNSPGSLGRLYHSLLFDYCLSEGRWWKGSNPHCHSCCCYWYCSSPPVLKLFPDMSGTDAVQAAAAFDAAAGEGAATCCCLDVLNPFWSRHLGEGAKGLKGIVECLCWHHWIDQT